jgi:hypothetical protein
MLHFKMLRIIVVSYLKYIDNVAGGLVLCMKIKKTFVRDYYTFYLFYEWMIKIESS